MTTTHGNTVPAGGAYIALVAMCASNARPVTSYSPLTTSGSRSGAGTTRACSSISASKVAPSLRVSNSAVLLEGKNKPQSG